MATSKQFPTLVQLGQQDQQFEELSYLDKRPFWFNAEHLMNPYRVYLEAWLVEAIFGPGGEHIPHVECVSQTILRVRRVDPEGKAEILIFGRPYYQKDIAKIITNLADYHRQRREQKKSLAPEAGTQGAADADPEAGTQEAADADPEAGTQEAADADPEAGTQEAADADPEAGTQEAADADPEAGTQEAADADPEAGTQEAADADPEAGTQEAADADPEAGTQGAADADPEAGTQGAADADPEAGTPGAADAAPEAEAGTPGAADAAQLWVTKL
ncbi:KH domain-containing protein 3-like [Elephas maximus indicus]|uniref:KH domain-containing protein 3-like n=1 Tax=Elephas maximus indicus TaxID=99487 RepID=UPI0021169550|nr:KH domain-containing protein 3-like [Elephas maximus indicus]